MKKLLSYLWTLWCAVAILIVLLLLFPALIIAVKSGIPSWKRKGHRLPSIGARVVLILWGIRVEERNRGILEKGRQYIFLGNHRSDLDIIVTAAIMQGYFKFFGKSQILNWPFFGFMVRHLYVSVDRGNMNSRRRSFATMESAVKDGASMMIYPEGWSNFSTANVLPLHKGGFELALRTGIPLAVFTIAGTHKLWPKPTLRLHPGKVVVYWETVLETGEPETSRNQLMEQVSEIWDRRLSAVYPDGIAPAPDAPPFEEWKSGKLHPTSGDQ